MYVKVHHDSFIKNNFHHNYNTRRQDDLLLPKHKLVLYEKSPMYMGIKLFNKLPRMYRDIINVRTFKTKVKEMLLVYCFYTIDEFLECQF